MLADLVHHATATTGTGTITLGAVVPGYRSFDDAIAAGELVDGATVTFGLVSGDGARGTEYGVFDETAGTLTRIAYPGRSLVALTGASTVFVEATAAYLRRDWVTVEPVDGVVTIDPADGENFNLDLTTVAGGLAVLKVGDVAGFEGRSGTIQANTAPGEGCALTFDQGILGPDDINSTIEVATGYIEGTTYFGASMTYVIRADGRLALTGYSRILVEVNPPPPARCAFQVAFQDVSDALVDPSTFFREIEFLDADDNPVLGNMTSSTAPSPEKAYGSPDGFDPEEDANAYKAMDGNTGTGFAGGTGNSTYTVFRDTGSATDTGALKVRVTPSEDVAAAGFWSCYVYAFPTMDAFVTGDWPSVYWYGEISNETLGDVEAGVPFTIDLEVQS